MENRMGEGTTKWMDESIVREFSFDEEPQSHVKSERIRRKRSLGRFRRAIPSMPLSLAVLCFLSNVFIPGLGTLLSSFSLISCADGAPSHVFINILCAFLQLITAPFIVGIIWSWQWGILFIQLARHWWTPIEKRAFSIDHCPCSSC
ncbi:hypothetical protein PRIPAC_91130 [Pristionchus pacificus]|nr:hypothetical protein PRIPAC_91130 [Pristionchus pacificus]